MTFQDLLLAAIQRSEIPLRFEPGAEEAVAKPVTEILHAWVSAHLPEHAETEYYAVPGEDLRTYSVYRAYRQDCSGAISRNWPRQVFCQEATFLLCADTQNTQITQKIFLTIRLS